MRFEAEVGRVAVVGGGVVVEVEGGDDNVLSRRAILSKGPCGNSALIKGCWDNVSGILKGRAHLYGDVRICVVAMVQAMKFQEGPRPSRDRYRGTDCRFYCAWVVDQKYVSPCYHKFNLPIVEILSFTAPTQDGLLGPQNRYPEHHRISHLP